MNLYGKPNGIQTRWASFENPKAEKGRGGTTNRGAKGRAFQVLAPGASLTLLDIKGSGTVCRIWLTFNDRSPQGLRSLRLDMFWDDAATSAVSAPLGDFFGIGLGQRRPFESALFSDPEGRSFNCSIPMPFRTGARIVVTNEGEQAQMFFYDVNCLMNVDHADSLYFHAHWRRESPNELGRDFTILPQVMGVGRYLGCNIGVITNPVYGEEWWGEGEAKVWLDGDTDYPTLCGTGAEDYIGSAWGQGEFAHRSQGCTVADKENRQWCFYRYHIDDPVFFEHDCRVAIQTIGGSGILGAIELQKSGAPMIPVSLTGFASREFQCLLDEAGEIDLTTRGEEHWCNFYRQDDWSSTAYFYLDRPENDLPPLANLVRRIEEPQFGSSDC